MNDAPLVDDVGEKYEEALDEVKAVEELKPQNEPSQQKLTKNQKKKLAK